METEADIAAEAEIKGRMEEIVKQYETPLLRYAARIVNSPSLAQDVVQNVFIKLFRGWEPGMKPSAGLKCWLYRVAHNEAVDFVRRESRLRIVHEKHAEDPADRSQDCHEDNNRDRKQMVLKHLKKLQPSEQQLILLRMEEGLSYKEISEVTGRSEGNVGNILHHAVKKLSEIVQKQKGS